MLVLMWDFMGIPGLLMIAAVIVGSFCKADQLVKTLIMSLVVFFFGTLLFLAVSIVVLANRGEVVLWVLRHYWLRAVVSLIIGHIWVHRTQRQSQL